jgi:fermentation-respiration switch protein FrsA (DUF1100 family)
MSWLKNFVIYAAAIYLGFVALLYVLQRGLMYFPERVRTPPAAAGLPQATEEMLTTRDGETLVAWHVPAKEGAHVVLYFHGNGGSLRLRAVRFRELVADGTGVLALSYRGYGGSTGSPSEAGLIEDAHTLYEFAVARYPHERLVLWGESLGAAVAIALAAKRPVGKIVLEAPFTSAVDLAASIYPFVPVRYLMKDQFRSDERIRAVKAPVLVIHGELDRVVPIRFGRRLFEFIPGPKEFVHLPRAGHEGLDEHGAIRAVKRFMKE